MTHLDFRSDTLTMPNKAMRACIANAEVGDDYYREDPTIHALEEYAAELLGKEAALFVLSGTMGNLVSVRAQVPHGSAAIVSNSSHIHINETGHLAAVCGLTSHPLPTPDGRYPLEVLKAFAPATASNQRSSVINPVLKLICVENTHNGEGGRCLDVGYLNQLREFASLRGLVFHMDGARFFNAAVALSRKPADLAAPADSVTFCLSKGLGAPGGSIVAGSRSFVEEARRWRQMVGGGMRQAGILAAAGLLALRENIDDLAIDHSNARRLASGLKEAGLDVNLDNVETNIVMAYVPDELGDARKFHARMNDAGVFVLPPKGNRLRFVTHRDLSTADVDAAVGELHRLTRNCKSGT
ncbi:MULTISPECIES: GntG family PLP-dependent aldolase [unclassified Mesorhizobium]|uniref:GntG family PLP-dependent aldolase n=1 Tax=unclassified Mesorhizobium TaxID=325217 RepID=UPI001AEDA409|nr:MULTISPECIES: GntG family PLP-dependent aldolase [unclassified Mesorhizobium]